MWAFAPGNCISSYDLSLQHISRLGAPTFPPEHLPSPAFLCTCFVSIAPSRAALLDVAATGPLVGTGSAAAVTFVGLVLSSAGITDVSIDSASFSDSFLMAVASQAFLGERLAQPVVEVGGWGG